MKVCASGTARSLINKFDVNEDGNGAWNALVKYYTNAGTVETYVAQLTSKLSKLRLEYNSYGGFETYKNDFDDTCQRIEEAGMGLSDLQKKTQFLEQINDRDYKSAVTFCRNTTSMGYDETIRTMRTEAEAMGKLKKNTQRRTHRNQRGNGKKGRRNNGNGQRSANQHNRDNRSEESTGKRYSLPPDV